MSGIVLQGLLLGMQHALEADHLAAVASINANSRGSLISSTPKGALHAAA